MKKLKLANSYAQASKMYFANRDMRLSARYWNRIYSLGLNTTDLVSVMQKFTDKEVYTITDYIRRRYYMSVGII